MLSLVLRAVALIFFIVAGANNTLFSQPPADLIAFGLALWVGATLLEGYGPEVPKITRAK